MAQHRRLELLAAKAPDARVVGWHERGGPVVQGPNGRRVRVSPLGRTNPLKRAA
jgi:hypothetical protein